MEARASKEKKGSRGNRYTVKRECLNKKRQKEKVTIKKPRYVPDGQMVRHTRNLKHKYLGKEEMKYIRSRYFQLRLSRARTELVKEAIPPIKQTVWIKARPGRPG